MTVYPPEHDAELEAKFTDEAMRPRGTVYIGLAGDPSVGIPDGGFTISDECLSLWEDEEEREEWRTLLRETFTQIVDERVSVQWEDEMMAAQEQEQEQAFLEQEARDPGAGITDMEREYGDALLADLESGAE